VIDFSEFGDFQRLSINQPVTFESDKVELIEPGLRSTFFDDFHRIRTRIRITGLGLPPGTLGRLHPATVPYPKDETTHEADWPDTFRLADQYLPVHRDL
jgi:hypothetical protein